MADAWDGRPENPERDGWHWLHHPEDLRPVVQPWSAEHGAWISGAMHSPQGVVDLGFCYLGPALLPAEVAAREAAAAEAMRASMLREIRRRVQVYRDEQAAWTAKRNASAANLCAAKAKTTLAALHDLEALPLPAADALARALERARAEEREACAKTALRTMLPDDCGPAEAHGRFQQAVACCEAIRARGKETRND